MIKQISLTLLIAALLTGCGGSDNDSDSNSSSSTPSSSSVASSSEAPSSVASSSAPASSEASSSESSAASSTPSADLSFGFEAGIDGWFVNGSENLIVTTELELSHDQINSALSIKPLTWVGDNYRRQARIALPSTTDFTGSTVTVVIDVPESYKTDASLVLQLVIQGSGYADSWNPVTGLVAGENTIVWNPTPEDPVNATGATHFGIQLSTAPSNTAILDAVLVKSILIDLPEEGSSSSSSSASSTPANVISYTFSADTQGWRNDYDTNVSVTHNVEASAVEITPAWAAQYQNVIEEIEVADFTGATIEYVYTVTQAQVDAGMQVQGYVQTGSPNYARIYGAVETPVAGENTLTFMPADDGSNIQAIQRIGFQLNGPLTGDAEDDTVLLNSVTVTLAP
ncbi:MAG TPA: hypothetical protein VL987_12890 [Cellvibrio sp.]|nr:hypothetical protein [Cellvibrio sp.]